MSKPTGGRGHKAKYDSTHARIPAPIKPLVESLADQYRAYVAEGSCLEFENKSLLPKIPAIYFVLEGEEIIYIGQTKDLCHRWQSHHLLKEFKELSSNISIAWLQCENIKLLRPIESSLIEAIKPRFNVSIRGETSGSFKPKWNLGKTQSIRIPIALYDWTIAIAKALDVGVDENIVNDIVKTFANDQDEGIRLLELVRNGKSIEHLIEQRKYQITLAALDRYVEEESQRDRRENQYGKDFKPKARTWDKFNQFREWVKAKITPD